MNKKMVTLILVILVSFCLLSIVVADNVTNDDNNTTDHGEVDVNKTTDKKNSTDDKADTNKTTDKDKKDDKSKKKYILAKGKGNNIKFSDGFRGFILDYSKSPASSGDEFKHESTSKVSNSNKLKLAIIECYKQGSTDKIAKIMADFIKTGSSNTKVGEAVSASHEKVSDHEVVKINNTTEAIFDFEVLKSVSGNESDYFAYKVSFKTVNDGEDIIQTNNLTNVTNTTNTTNKTNVTNTTNITNMTPPNDNGTNATFWDDLYGYLAFILDALYDAWRPIIDTLLNFFLMINDALNELMELYENFMMEIQSFMDAIEELLEMLQSIWNELGGLLKLFGLLLTAAEQLLKLFVYLVNTIGQLFDLLVGVINYLLNLLGSLLNFLSGILSWLLSLLQQLLGLLFDLLNFFSDLINQLLSLIQAILDFLKSAGSYLIKVIDNAVVLISAFVIIAIGAFVYNRIR